MNLGFQSDVRVSHGYLLSVAVPPTVAISVNVYLDFMLVLYVLHNFISHPRHLVPCYAAQKKLVKYKWTVQNTQFCWC